MKSEKKLQAEGTLIIPAPDIHPDERVHRRRRVKITKLLGDGSAEGFQPSHVGIEEAPPEAGRSYRVRTGEKTIFCSSPVVCVYIQTQNSIYRIEALD